MWFVASHCSKSREGNFAKVEQDICVVRLANSAEIALLFWLVEQRVDI
jgi:hypothetical protein